MTPAEFLSKLRMIRTKVNERFNNASDADRMKYRQVHDRLITVLDTIIKKLETVVNQQQPEEFGKQ